MKKKYVPKKRRSFKRKSTIKKLAKKVNKLTRQVETKYYNISGLGALPDNNPTLGIRPYTNISQGLTDYGSRIGDKITVKYLRLNTQWELGAGVAGRSARIIVFVMKENPDSVAAAWSTIWNLYQESAYANSINVVNGVLDYDNRSGFTTLYDVKRDLNPTNDTLASTHKWNVNIKIPVRCQKVQYVNNGATISRNELFIALLQDTDTGLSVNYVSQFFYSDA